MRNVAEFALVAWLAGCTSHAPPKSQGFEAKRAEAGCAAALLVAESDYTSTNVSVVGADGAELSDSFISSQSAPPGLTTALSGDIVFPSAPPRSGQVVLIDRYPNSVLTFIDPETAKVERQIAVGTGFGANPHDYLELSADLAFVTRFESNPKPGRQKLDAGGDVLVLDPGTGRLLESIDLTTPEDGDFLPRPDHMLRQGDEVWVVLQGMTSDFKKAREARIVAISTSNQAIAWTLSLDGFSNCGGLALSPSGKQLALACSGVLGDDIAASPASDVLLLDVTKSPPELVQHFGAAQQLGAPLGSAIAFVSETTVIGTAFGDGATRNDIAYVLELETGRISTLLNAGASFAFGDLHCSTGCKNALCFLTDAQAGALDVWRIGSNDELERMASITTGSSVGLPPRGLGAW